VGGGHGLPPKRSLDGAPTSSQIDDFAGVHAVVGVEGALEGAHDFESFAVLGLHVLLLAEADAVLAGAGAAHGDGAFDEAAGEGFGLGGLRRQEETEDVKISVAHVADDGGGEAGGVEIGAGGGDAVG